MATDRIPAGREELAGIVRAAFGARSRLHQVTRLPGSSKKGVYRAVLDDDFTAIVYVWAAAENYWPAPAAEAEGGTADPFSPASGLDLFEASARDTRIGAASARLADTLRRHAALVGPRSDYSLIHGELGPDHVLVDRQGRPVVIDIEGLMYFDAEWEHVFLDLRFGPDYRFLREPGLDTGRLDLYRLAMHLSLVAGPLRLLDGDFPDREPMLRIAEYNTRQVLARQHP